MSYPTGKECALCVRFCPQYFKLREHEENVLDLPFRMIFAVATSRSVLIYDSQQSTPIYLLSHIHMARLTDLSWSSDARLLMISSTDAYCTFAIFEFEELGEEDTAPKPLKNPTPKQAATPKLATPKSATKSRMDSPARVEVKPVVQSGPRQSSLLQFIQTSKQPIEARRIEVRPIQVRSEDTKIIEVKSIAVKRLEAKPKEVKVSDEAGKHQTLEPPVIDISD